MKSHILAFFLVALSLYAKAGEPPLLKLSLEKEPLIVRQERIAAAKDISERAAQLRSLLITPRPSEREWVRAERAEITRTWSVNRAANLDRSIELNNINLYDRLGQLIENTQCLVRENIRVNDELLCWIRLVEVVITNDWRSQIEILQREGKLPDTDGFGWYKAMLPSLGMNVLKGIIEPFFKGQIR